MKKLLKVVLGSILGLSLVLGNLGAVQAAGSTLIKNVELLGAPGGELYNIAIEDHKILSIGKELPKGFQADEVVDGKGKLVTPGMVNTHGHVSMTLLRSYADDLALEEWLTKHIWPREDKLTSEDIYWGAMLGIAEMLKSGTTTYADMYFHTDEIAKATAELGIRGNLSQCLIAFRPTAEADLRESVELFEKWHSYDAGRIRISLGPHAPYTCTDEYLQQVIAAARQKGIELQMHLCETKDEVVTSQKEYGMNPIERMAKLGLLDCGVIADHAVHLTEKDMQLLAQHKVRVASCPQSNLKLASGIADITGMLQQGILVGLGTDGASSNNNLDMLEEIRLTAMLHKGNTYDPTVIPAETAWKMGTVDGARVLGFANVGELKAGQAADIVLWRMDKPHWYPQHNKLSLLVYAANSNDVDTVFVNGKKVVEKGKLLTFDEKKIYREFKAHANALLKR